MQVIAGSSPARCTRRTKMDKLVVVERENPQNHPNPVGTHYVCWNREWSIVTYGDTRDEAVFMAGIAEGHLDRALQEHGQPTSKPESEWLTRAQALEILNGAAKMSQLMEDILESFEEAKLSGAAGKTIEQIREEHGLPAH